MLVSFALFGTLATASAAPGARDGDPSAGATTFDTTTQPGPTRHAAPAAKLGPPQCTKNVGVLGDYYRIDMMDFLIAEGHTVFAVDKAEIQGGLLEGLDVLFINRAGTADAGREAGAIEEWVRGGGILITEFDATAQLFDGVTYGFFPGATKDDCLSIPADICGTNNMVVGLPCDVLATDLPPSWCSGDPFGVFKVYDESTLPVQMQMVMRLDVDTNGDGVDDAAMGSTCVDDGAVVAFFSDFGDWRPQSTCGYCIRTVEEEQLLRNAICLANTRCTAQCSVAVYCTSKAGSCAPAQVCASGTPSATATSGFEIFASPVPANVPGVLMYTDAGRACIPFASIGTLCIGSPFFGTSTLNSAGTVGCTGELRIDMNCFASGACGGSPQPFLSVPGTRVSVQYAFADGSPIGSLRLSDAGEYVVLP